MAASIPQPRGARAHLWARLAVLAGAVLVGLALEQVVAARLAEIELRSATDMLGARAELAGLLRGVGGSVLGLTAALGALIVAACRRSLALGRFPPTGLLSWGAGGVRGVLTGREARTRANVGSVLGALVFLLSIAALGLLWYLTNVLLACRA